MRPRACFRISMCVCSGLSACTARAETCYGYRGFAMKDQQFCEGSGACCSNDDECMPNRLCKSRGDADNILVRGSCSSRSWDKESNCAEICNFDEIEQNTGLQNGVFPRVEICDEGVYCCRQGTASCCDRNIRVVYLDEDGVRLSEPPASTTSTWSISVSTSTSSTAPRTWTTSTSELNTETSAADTTSTTSEASDTDSPKTTSSPVDDNIDDNSNTLGLTVGLGVGIPLAVISTALATWFFFWKRRIRHASGIRELAYTYSQGPHSRDPGNTMEQNPAHPHDQFTQSCPPYDPDSILRQPQPQPQELETRPVARPWSFAPSDEMAKHRMSEIGYEEDLVSPSSR